jgi:hypothetical protein
MADFSKFKKQPVTEMREKQIVIREALVGLSDAGREVIIGEALRQVGSKLVIKPKEPA